MAKLLGLVLLGLIVISCGTPPKQSGIDLSIMDTTFRPTDDFYMYMNGQWLKKYDIPADKSNYGTFSKLADEAERNLQKIIEESANAKDKKPGSDIQKVGDMYLSFMDSARAERLGFEPIKSDIAAIQAAKTREDLVNYTAYSARVGSGNPFFIFVNQDSKKTTEYIVYLFQGGLSLPDRDYYLRTDPRFGEIRAAFITHMERMFKLAGIPDGAAKAKKVMAIEVALAKAHWTNVENRDRNKTYNKFALSGKTSFAPGFDWNLYAAKTGITTIDSLVVYQPSYFKAFGKLFASLPLEDWKAYCTWRTLTNWSPLLSSNAVSEDFDFFSKTLEGTQENRARWKRAVASIEGAMGEIVGRIYVERHFKPEAKEHMVKLVANLKESFRERIKGLTWMTDETKQKALAKLEKFGTKIGYPDKWKDYSALEIKADDLVGNVRRASIAEFERNMKKLGKPIDRKEWGMTPQTVNAYYNPSMNEIVFPAAILQPPFFNMDADDAVNYGGIGAVIGHEMTHGFDDQGRKSDGDGTLTDWWTPKDAEQFEQRAGILVDQYGAYSPIDTLKLNGKMTLGENIADVGGVTIAYYAYKKSLNGKQAPVIDGKTGEQRFFLGWAQVWARKYRDDEMRRRVLTDPHSPSQYRANGVVANLPEFYAAFGVKEGDALYRPESIRAQIW